MAAVAVAVAVIAAVAEGVSAGQKPGFSCWSWCHDEQTSTWHKENVAGSIGQVDE